MSLEIFIEKMKKMPEEDFRHIISKYALNLDVTQIDTVSFVFWLCYMAEVDLGEVIKQAWAQSAMFFSDEVNINSKHKLNQMIGGKGIDIEKLEYFSEKIKIYQVLFGKDNDRTKLLWKINDIRNDLSHNRISNLKYEDKDLFLRTTKEKLLTDYFTTSINQNRSKSVFWNNLTEDQKNEIDTLYNKIKL